MKRTLIYAALTGMILAMLVGLASAQTDPRTLPPLTASQITYLGSFTAPQSSVPGSTNNGDKLEYGGTALGIGPDGRSLFIGCHAQVDTFGRISIPAIGGAASIVERCQPIPNFNAIANAQGRVNGLVVGGSLFAGGKLYVNGYTFYDNTGGHIATTFAGATIGTLAGPWKMHPTWPGMFAGGMTTIPAEWQAALGGDALSGLCCISTIGRSSFGPAMFAFRLSDVSASNASTWLVGYDEAHKTLGPYDSAGEYYGMAMTMGGLGWLPGTRSPFAIVNRPTTYCYGEGTMNKALDRQPNGKGQIFCYDPFNDNSNGYHSEDYELSLIVYDANDLAAVKAGTKQPWAVLPTQRIALPGTAKAKEIRGATLDPATGRLYVAMDYGANPRIHVWQIGAPVVTPPPPPKVNCAGVWSESLSEPTPPVCDASQQQTRTRTRTFTATTLPANGGDACPASPVVTQEVSPCVYTPPPPPVVPSFVGRIRSQAEYKAGGLVAGIRLTLQVPASQTVPAVGAAVRVSIPLANGQQEQRAATVYSRKPNAYAGTTDWQVVVQLPGVQTLAIRVEVP